MTPAMPEESEKYWSSKNTKKINVFQVMEGSPLYQLSRENTKPSKVVQGNK